MTEQEIFIEAMDRTDRAEQQRFLDEACAGDAALRERVEKLIYQADQLGSFLEHPPVEAAVAEGNFGSAGSGDPDATILHEAGSTEDNGHATALERTMKHDSQEQDDEIPLGYLQPSTKPNSLGRLGHYEVLEVVGRGAFGTVLRAFDEKLQRVVAIKVLAPEMAATSPARKRFLREARTSAAIRHENVVAIHAVEDEPIPYLVMEYIPGQTLQQRLDKSGPLPVLDVLKLGKQIADGLAAAHAQDLIHRDIKPGNILLEGGVSERVKITDFGLARTADDASMTQSGLIAGTPMYMAPEQAMGLKLDQRADLFSFGSVLYQMLSGRPPFRAANTVAVLKRVVDDTPRPIQEIIPEVPTWMCDVVSRLHAKNPDERFQTAREVSELLAKCLDDLKAGRTPKIASPSRSIEKTEIRPAATIGSRETSRLSMKLLARVATVLVLLAFIAIRWMPPRSEPTIQSPPDSQTSAITTPSTGSQVRPTEAPPPAVVPFDSTQAKAHQEAWAKHLGVPVEYTNSIGMKFRLIPPGEFMMGSTPDEIAADLEEAGEDKHWQECIQSETPRHKVTLTQPIYLGVNEVTQAEYEKVMGVNPSQFSPKGLSKGIVTGLETGRHPVEMVSWNDAAEFCAMLSQQDGLKPFYFRSGETVAIRDGLGYRLPSEAEWEFACRAGTATKFWGGDKDEDLARAGWFNGNSGGRTHAVGELQANPFGLYDIHGNVWEWVQDGWNSTYYGQFAEKAAINPASPFTPGAGSRRVLRGGDWLLIGPFCRSAHRHAVGPSGRDQFIGFRVSLSVDAVKEALAARTPAVTNTKRDAPSPAIAPFNAAQAKAHQEAWAKHLGVPVEYTNSIGMKFRLIPPGEFLMGSTADEIEVALKEVSPNETHSRECVKSEAPRHKVILTQPVYLGVKEVTQAEYEKVMGVNPSHFAPTGMGKEAVAGLETARLPVDTVSWNDAAEFCIKLSQQEKLKPFYSWAGESITPLDGTGYRLPSEAEWEFACRAGTTTKYWIGDSYEDLVRAAWSSGNSGGHTHVAGELQANPFGLYDIHGNLWEWVHDGWDVNYYSQFEQKPAINPISRFYAGSAHLIRGGSWRDSAYGCRPTYREAPYEPTLRVYTIGFRVSLPVDAVNAALAARTPAVTNTKPDAPSPAIAPFDAAQAKAHQEAWAKHLGVPVEYTNSIGMKFRLIPPGEFLMGSTADEIEAALTLIPPDTSWWQEAIKSEAPKHKVVLTQPVYFGETEVTQAQYEQVMGTNSSQFASTGDKKEVVANLPTGTHPVETVSWNDAAEFCAKLSQQARLKPFYARAGETISLLKGTGYRLSSEAEWEFACRAGTTTRFWSGNDDVGPFEAGWALDNSAGRTHPAGESNANPFGLSDMHGNVWEWVQDGWDAAFYGQFTMKAAVDPFRPFAASARRVMRGGSLADRPFVCGSSGRNAHDPSIRDCNIGFRVVLPVDAVKQSLSGMPEMTTLGAEVRSSKTTESWVSLFNGRDLTGWKTLPELPGQWEVKDGALTGTEKPSYLFSERGNFENFHLRAEVKLNGLGDSGIYFRTPFEFGHGPKAWMVFPATGYELELSDQPKPRGTIWQEIPGSPPRPLAEAIRITEDDTGDWITVELIAEGAKMTIKLNGREVTKGIDPVGRYRRGHFALALTNPKTVVQFRKIEIRELPPSPPPANPEPQTRLFASDEWIDVIPMIDPKLDKWDNRFTGKNEWRIENGELIVGDADDKPSKLLFPIDADFWPSFECELQFTRRSGEAGFNVNFPALTGDTTLSFEFPNVPGVFLRELDAGKGKPVMITNNRQLETGKRMTMRFEVRHQSRGDRIQVWKDETLLGTWRGDRTQLVNINNEGYPHNRRMSLWIHSGVSEFVFHHIRLRMLDWGTAHSIRSVADAPTPVTALPPLTDAEVKRIASLPVADQVEEVRKELIKRNPGFDAKVEYKIEKGVVASIKILTDHVTDITPLRVFQSLKDLDCSGTYPAKGALADLSPLRSMNLSQLINLELRENNKISDADLDLFKDCQKLVMLGLNGTGTTDKGLAHFSQCNELKMHFLKKTRITDTGLAHFKDHPSLEKIILEGTTVTDQGLSHVQNCDRLTHLWVSNTRITDDGLLSLKDCRNLQVLAVTETQVTESGLGHLKDCPLKYLHIQLTKITDLSVLKNWPLKEVICDFVPARDTETLRSITTLERINDKPAAEFWKNADQQ